MHIICEIGTVWHGVARFGVANSLGLRRRAGAEGGREGQTDYKLNEHLIIIHKTVCIPPLMKQRARGGDKNRSSDVLETQ